jgi:hypothetical protein
VRCKIRLEKHSDRQRSEWMLYLSDQKVWQFSSSLGLVNMSSLVLCTSLLCYVRRHHFCGQLQTCAKIPNREWRMRCLVYVLSLSSSCRALMLLSCLVFYCVITFKCYCLVLYCCLVLSSHSCVDQWSLSAPCVVICYVLCCHLFFPPLQLVRNE